MLNNQNNMLGAQLTPPQQPITRDDIDHALGHLNTLSNMIIKNLSLPDSELTRAELFKDAADLSTLYTQTRGKQGIPAARSVALLCGPDFPKTDDPKQLRAWLSKAQDSIEPLRAAIIAKFGQPQKVNPNG